MRELDDALKALSEFESLVRYGIHPGGSLEKVGHENKWDSFELARLEFRVGQLTVVAHAHASRRIGHLDVAVWDFIGPSEDAYKFDMGADVEHVARVVVDYLNEYEATA